MEQPKEYKTIAFRGFKIVDEDQGIVEHLVSIFGNEDLGGDVVHPGAFTKTLQERGDRIRVLDSHRRESILDVLGKSLDLKEIPRDKLPPEILQDYPEATGGLWARTQFLLDTPEGKGAFARIKSGAVDEFSFGYDTLDEDFSNDDKGHEVRNLRTLRLWEYSPVIFGMNPATTVTGVKSEDKEIAPVSMGGEEWTVEKALDWVKNHQKDWVVAVEKLALSYTRTIQRVRDAFNRTYNLEEETYDYWVKEVFDEFLIVEASVAQVCFKVAYVLEESAVTFAPQGEWISGEYVFVAQGVDDPAKQQGGGAMDLITIEQAQIEIELASTGAGPSE